MTDAAMQEGTAATTASLGEDEDVCPVCIMPLEGIVEKLPCGHTMHTECTDKWVCTQQQQQQMRRHQQLRWTGINRCPYKCSEARVVISFDDDHSSTTSDGASPRQDGGSSTRHDLMIVAVALAMSALVSAIIYLAYEMSSRQDSDEGGHDSSSYDVTSTNIRK